MSQSLDTGFDIEVFKRHYDALAGQGGNGSSVTQNLERLAGMAASIPTDAQPSPEKTADETAREEMADSVASNAVTDMGDVETIDLSAATRPAGLMLPAGDVMRAFSEYQTPQAVAFDRESGNLDQTLTMLHTLGNRLNLTPFEAKSLAGQSGLSVYAVDKDPAFARKKIASDAYARRLHVFAETMRQSPQTAALVAGLHPVEQIAVTSDEALTALEKDLTNRELGFFESGYINSARNAWELGMLSRESTELGMKWMTGAITEEERRRLDAIQQTLGYFQEQREGMGLLERMVRGTVESVVVPLYGGLEGAGRALGRYGKEALAAGAGIGAMLGSAAGGVGALPGAVAGGLKGLGAVALAGGSEDMMRQEGVQNFLTLVNMGVPEDLSRIIAIVAGGAKGGLEFVGLRGLGRLFPGAETLLNKESIQAALTFVEKNPRVKKVLGTTFAAMLKAAGAEVGTEMAQEAVDITAEEAGRRLSGINRAEITNEEIRQRLVETLQQTLESVAIPVAAGGVARGVRNRRARVDALDSLVETQRATLDTVANAAQNSPVIRDMPETGEALVQHLSDAGVAPKQVFLAPEAVQQEFFQEEDPELMAAAEALGITPESLEENLALGTDVAINFAKATQHILSSPERYAALRDHMRLSPAMPTGAEMHELESMNADAEVRQRTLDDILSPLAEEVDEAQNRYQQRMDIAEPYMEQWRAAGYTENQAEAFGLVLAANAERMAPLYGQTPAEYLEQRLAGYHAMSREEFENLGEGGLDALFENRETAALLQEMGVTRGMSRTRRRRVLQPEFAYAYGKISPESVQNLYGMERFKELRRQFGPGFFAKKGEGIHIDALAHGFMSEERGAYDLNRDAVDVDAFAETVFMPHDEFESGIGSLLRGQTYYQAGEPVQVSGATLGVPDGSDIREYIRAAKPWHDRLKYESEHGRPVIQPQLDKPVRFSKKGWEKNRFAGARPEKWKLFPYLREIIETSTLFRTENVKGKKGFSKVHLAVNTVVVDGKKQAVGFTLLEDSKGNLFYNIADDINNTKIGKALQGGAAEQTLGHEGLFQDETSSVESKITPDADGVNLQILESRAADRARGAIRRMDDGRYVVGLFKRRNASTVLHETAHFWLEELRQASLPETAPEWVRDAWAKLEKAYGFERARLTPDSWREVQERFAREFEAYVRDGKAPSWELQTAFNRFRNWLSEIYRSIRAILGANEVSPDVREVFDALLATDEEIEQSRRAVERGSVMESLGGEVAPELRDRYARAVQKAHENAAAVIANRRLVDRRKAEREFLETATATIDGSETYRMIARLRQDGIPFDALKGAIAEDLAYRLREKWRRAAGEGRALIRKGGTLDILDVAAQFNEDTAQGLASALLDTPTRREAIDAEVDARLAEWDAAYDAEVEYSSAYDEVLALEMEALTGRRQVSPAALRQRMDERTDARRMSQVDAEYQALKARLRSEERATRHAAHEARKERNAVWRERMAELREKERLRRAALGSAYRARMERDAIVRQLRKIGDSRSIPYEYMCQIRRLLGRFAGLGTPGQRLDPATLRGLPSLQEFLAGMAGPFGEEVTAPEWLLENTPGRFADLSLEQMRELKNLITELAHAGRSERRMLTDRQKRETREVAEACAAQMSGLSQREYISERAGVLDTVRGALRKGLSSITSMRFLARWMDGFQKQGVNHEAWFLPLQEARSRELALLRDMEEKLRAAVAPLLKIGTLTEAFELADVPLQQDVNRLWKGLWDMDKVYSVALNMGNAGNLKALMTGYGWSEENLGSIVGRLTAEEWRGIQAVWDAIDSLYPQLNETYTALRGVPLPKVRAKAFTVVTADGLRLRLKGGYYPLIFDQRLSGKAAENQSVDEMLNGTEAVLRTPNPKSGMTNARKGGTLPPRLSMTVIDRHVADTAHYITHALPLRDAMRLFREPAFKAAFVNAAGQENYDQLLPWLRGIARPDGEQMRGIMKAMEWMAKRGTMYAMGMNMKSALLQLTSIGNSWSEVGTGNFLRAAATILSGPRECWNTIRQKSAYMQNRAQFMDESLRREYAEMRANGVGGVRFRDARYALDMVQKAQFALITALDTVVAAPTWLAAYDRAIAEGVDESRAVAEADAAVVAAQGGGGALDAPAVMRQAGFMRILCPFMSFALSDFNRKLETVRGLREWRKTGNSAVNPRQAFMDFALQWVMPVMLSCLMVGLGRDDEVPDAEDYAWEALTFYTMGIPLARDFARMAQDQFSSSGFRGARTPLAYAGVENLLRGAKHAKQALVDDKRDAGYRVMKEAINSVGFFLGIGTPQIWRTVEGSEAYFVDDEGGILAPLLGKPQKK